jgi:outer membrane protein
MRKILRRRIGGMMTGKRFALIAIGGWLAMFAAGGARAQEVQKLALGQAVTLAMQNSRDLALARVQYAVAKAAASVDRADFRPNLYTGSGAAYTNGFPSTPSGAAPSVFNVSYMQTVLNQPLRGQLKAAEERAEERRLEVDRVRDDVIVRTASAYLELAKVRHSLELLRSEEASAEKILGVMRERAAAGQELPIEITRSELTLARVRERIIKLEGSDENLAQQLRNLTGIGDEKTVEVQSEEPSFASDQQESELMALALRNSYAIKEAEHERAARDRIYHGEKGGYLPTVDLIGLYQVLAKFNNYNEFFQPNSFQRNNITVGISAHIPIFSQKTRASVGLAKTQLQEAELQLGNRRQQVRLDVQQKAQSVRELDAGREVARLDLKLARESLEMVQAKFEQGQATLRDIEQARLDESDRWVAFLDAEFARQQGQLTLLQATGQLAKVFQ